MLKKLFILFSCLLLIVQQAKAQNQTWEVGAGGGPAGLMYNSFPKDFTKYSGSFVAWNLKRNFKGYFAAKFEYLSSTKSIYVKDTISLSSGTKAPAKDEVRDLSLLGEFNFLNYIVEESKSFVTPYFVGGISFPTKKFEDNNSQKFIFGVGVKYNPFGRWNLIGEYRYRFGFPFNSVASNYKFASLGLSYTFVNKKCPTVITNRKRRWGFLR
jgi:hypothetical protein